MGLFAKKCEYCRTKIDNGREVKRDVRVAGYVGTQPKIFCSEEHAGKYEQEAKTAKKGSGGCCG